MTVAPTWSRPEVLGFRDVAAVMELLRAREGTHLRGGTLAEFSMGGMGGWMGHVGTIWRVQQLHFVRVSTGLWMFMVYCGIKTYQDEISHTLFHLAGSFLPPKNIFDVGKPRGINNSNTWGWLKSP